MKQKKNNYFLKRFVKQENIAHKLSEKKQEQLKKIYREARRELESDLAFFIERYSKENEFTAADLKKMLNTKEKAEFRYSIKGYVEEIERLGKDSKEAKMLKKELDIMAGRTRVSRKQELITSINYELSKASLKTNNEIKKHLTDVVEFVIKDTHKIISGNTLTKLDPKLIENIVNQKWDSKNYSSRVWSNKKGLADKVMKHITTGFIQGHDYKKMSDRLVKDMNVGYYEARRILQTETTGAIENAKTQTFKDLGVTKYKFIATIDDRTSEICRSLDGKIFDMKDRQIGVNCPFMHPFCRSVTVPIFDDKAKDKKLRENSEEALKNNEKNGNIKTKEFKKINGKHSFEEDLKNTNPYYDKNKNYKTNCQRCVNAYEARRRGFDVIAKPFSNDSLSKMFHGQGWPNVYKDYELIDCSSISSIEPVDMIEHLMSTWGDGARAIIRVVWKNYSSGHVFVAEQISGKTIFLDPQTGVKDVKYYFNEAKKTGIYIMRVDNLEFTNLIDRCCEEVD